jgi:hypothetical protein
MSLGINSPLLLHGEPVVAGTQAAWFWAEARLTKVLMTGLSAGEEATFGRIG